MRISQQTSSHDDRIVLLYFEGDLNAGDCGSTAKVFQDIIDSKKYFIIALMENVTFVSSPFLGELMGCKLRLVEKGGNMVIVGLGYDLREKLIQMGADKIFNFYPDTHTAYNHYHWEYTQTAQVVTLTMPPRLQAVPALRRFISGIARQKGYTARDAFRIETIVDEIANNAIEHGDASQGEVGLELRIDRKKFELLVRNKTLIDKAEQLRQVIEANRDQSGGNEARGRGLALVKLISNSINVSIDKSGTEVKITKMREDS
ncbi:MAG TPA: ATP-binding protein [Fibrobacteria bacterium]|nr:ATP-binding protein [Fibrobacteria bacterium]